MKIEIIGAGGGSATELGNTSMLLWKDNGSQAILLDCGYTVFPRLREMEIERKKEIIKKIDMVFVSHTHADHVGSLAALLESRYYNLNECTWLAGVDVKKYLEESGVYEDMYQCVVDSSDRFKMMQTEHAPNKPSVGCLIDDKVFYSGDTGYSLLDTDFAKRAEVIIHEVAETNVAAFLKGKETGRFLHVGIDCLGRSGTPEIRKKTWLTHYFPETIDLLWGKVEQYGFAGLLEPDQIIEV